MKKTLVVLTAIAGLGLSGAVQTSAQAAPTARSLSSSAVGQVSAAPPCSGGYPASVYTTTRLRLQDHRVRRGERNKAIVKVRSAGRADPRGIVHVTVNRKGRGRSYQVGERLDDGVARVALPRRMNPGRYKVTARYFPANCSQWAGSRSNRDHLRVVKGRGRN